MQRQAKLERIQSGLAKDLGSTIPAHACKSEANGVFWGAKSEEGGFAWTGVGRLTACSFWDKVRGGASSSQYHMYPACMPLLLMSKLKTELLGRLV